MHASVFYCYSFELIRLITMFFFIPKRYCFQNYTLRRPPPLYSALSMLYFFSFSAYKLFIIISISSKRAPIAALKCSLDVFFCCCLFLHQWKQCILTPYAFRIIFLNIRAQPFLSRDRITHTQKKPGRIEKAK